MVCTPKHRLRIFRREIYDTLKFFRCQGAVAHILLFEKRHSADRILARDAALQLDEPFPGHVGYMFEARQLTVDRGRSGVPAMAVIQAKHPDVELTAVCTTRPESAEEARQALGAKLAFHDVRAMVASPEIDAVAVVVRVPSHYEPTRAAIEAGKHVDAEWPLGRTTAEAEALAAGGPGQWGADHGRP